MTLEMSPAETFVVAYHLPNRVRFSYTECESCLWCGYKGCPSAAEAEEEETERLCDPLGLVVLPMFVGKFLRADLVVADTACSTEVFVSLLILDLSCFSGRCPSSHWRSAMRLDPFFVFLLWRRCSNLEETYVWCLFPANLLNNNSSRSSTQGCEQHMQHEVLSNVIWVRYFWKWFDEYFNPRDSSGGQKWPILIVF